MTGHEGIRLDDVEDAVVDIAAGRPVIVVDDEDRENEGDIIFAASKSTPELMAFTIRHSSGVICAPMPGDMLERLEIPLMTPHNRDKMRTAYTISVDARDGVSTGISAADRSHTVRTLADSATEPWELTRPGHVFPLRYREGGVLVRRGHTEAAVDLTRMAGLTPVGVLVEVVNDDGTMKRGPELRDFADEHGLTHDLDRADGPPPPARRVATSSGSRPPGCRPASATSPPSATGSRSTAPSTSRWCTATRPASERRAGADPGALGVPDRRRLRQQPLRLRAPARRGDGAHRRRGSRRRDLPARPRGARHRPAGQAAGLPAAGRRPGHRRRQPRARPAGRRPPLRRRHPDPQGPRRRVGAADDQQPGQDRGPRGLRRRGRRAASRSPRTPTTTTWPTCRPSGTGWVTTCPTWPAASTVEPVQPVEPVTEPVQPPRRSSP